MVRIKKKFALIFVVVFVLILKIGVNYYFDNKPTQKRKEYTSDQYKISLLYPADWKRDYEDKDTYKGVDGFFTVSSFSGDNMIFKIFVREQLRDTSLPYGSNAQIKLFIKDRQNAALILPSIDQNKKHNKQALFVLEYPKSIHISTATTDYLLFWAEKSHIEELSKSIRFLGNQSPIRQDKTYEEVIEDAIKQKYFAANLDDIICSYMKFDVSYIRDLHSDYRWVSCEEYKDGRIVTEQTFSRPTQVILQKKGKTFSVLSIKTTPSNDVATADIVKVFDSASEAYKNTSTEEKRLEVIRFLQLVNSTKYATKTSQ